CDVIDDNVSMWTSATNEIILIIYLIFLNFLFCRYISFIIYRKQDLAYVDHKCCNSISSLNHLRRPFGSLVAILEATKNQHDSLPPDVESRGISSIYFLHLQANSLDFPPMN